MSEGQWQLYQRVFKIIVRMSNPRESISEFLDKDAYADIIYKNKLFDIPKILGTLLWFCEINKFFIDISVLYGSFHSDLIRNTILTLFELQPKYINDLNSILPNIAQVIAERTSAVMNPKNGNL